MLNGVWGWIERSAYAAFMRGIQRGVDELTTAASEDAPPTTLRLTFTPPEEEPVKRKKA